MKDEDVEPAVVVEIVDAAAPTCVLRRGLRDSGARTDVFESVLSGVAHQSVVLGIGDQEIEAAVAINVGEYRAHGRRTLAVLAVGDTEITGQFFKCPIPLVVKQEVL